MAVFSVDSFDSLVEGLVDSLSRASIRKLIVLRVCPCVYMRVCMCAYMRACAYLRIKLSKLSKLSTTHIFIYINQIFKSVDSWLIVGGGFVMRSLREEMPATAAAVDWFRAALGAAEVNALIKAGMAGAPTFYAIENGKEIGTKIPEPKGGCLNSEQYLKLGQIGKLTKEKQNAKRK